MKRINAARRRYLLTGEVERPALGSSLGYGGLRCFVGGRWAIQLPGFFGPAHVQVYFFQDAGHRARWIALNPGRRQAVGKRHPAVKAFRNDMQRPKPHEAIASY